MVNTAGAAVFVIYREEKIGLTSLTFSSTPESSWNTFTGGIAQYKNMGTVKRGWDKLHWEALWETVPLWLLRQRPSCNSICSTHSGPQRASAQGCGCFTGKQLIGWLKIKGHAVPAGSGQACGRPIGVLLLRLHFGCGQHPFSGFPK